MRITQKTNRRINKKAEAECRLSIRIISKNILIIQRK
jgi:hypothetical protein